MTAHYWFLRNYVIIYNKIIIIVLFIYLSFFFFFFFFFFPEPASEYVISIRAFNNAGQGRVKLETVTTSEETSKSYEKWTWACSSV